MNWTTTLGYAIGGATIVIGGICVAVFAAGKIARALWGEDAPEPWDVDDFEPDPEPTIKIDSPE